MPVNAETLPRQTAAGPAEEARIDSGWLGAQLRPAMLQFGCQRLVLRYSVSDLEHIYPVS